MAKQLDVVTGLVERINDKGTGLRVGGEWANASQYVNPPIEMPKPGQRVNLTVERTDRGIWIQSVEVLDGGEIHQLPQQQRRGGGRFQSDPRDIRRQSALRSAVMFAAARPDLKSADVVKLADHFLVWLEQSKGGDQSI